MAAMTARGSTTGVPGRWWHVVGGLVVGIVAASVVGQVLIATADVDTTDELALWTVVPLQLALWSGLVGAPLLAAHRAGRPPAEAYDLTQAAGDVPLGLVAGVATQLVLVPLVYAPLLWLVDGFDTSDISEAAEELTGRADALWERGLLAAVVVIGAPVVEELFYRGLLQGLLLRVMPPVAAVPVGAAIFAVTHFLVVSVPALFVFGLLAGTLAYRTGRLGPAIWLHVGFNLTTVLVLF